MEKLASTGLIEPLKAYIASGRPFMGICVGMQALVESSEESPDAKGLGIIPATCVKFNDSDKVVPQMGWNSVSVVDSDEELVNHAGPGSKYYFVHSYGIRYTNDVSDELKKWVHTLTTYGEETFISSVRKGNVFATQFHPEKSGLEGLKVINSFLECSGPSVPRVLSTDFVLPKSGFVNRIIACLDVRENGLSDSNNVQRKAIWSLRKEINTMLVSQVATGSETWGNLSSSQRGILMRALMSSLF
jgi:glutamine amidotransferase/cyclase